MGSRSLDAVQALCVCPAAGATAGPQRTAKGPSVPEASAPLAQLDRASDFESEGRRFESYGVR
jgi:hypothetical protein